LIAYGGAVGGAVHSGIAYVCVGLFSPVLKFVSQYERLLEAYLWFKLGIIDSAKVKELVDHTIDQRFGIKPKHDTSQEVADASAINKLADRVLLKIGAGDKGDSTHDY
jgi:hypothetical protein